jgi:methionine synthase I (cobalamin-dependent)
MDSFRNVLDSDRIHVVDGAMGTMLYAKGVYINRCYDELNLSNFDLVGVRRTHTPVLKRSTS